jgi:hypothetical protein
MFLQIPDFGGIRGDPLAQVGLQAVLLPLSFYLQFPPSLGQAEEVTCGFWPGLPGMEVLAMLGPVEGQHLAIQRVGLGPVSPPLLPLAYLPGVGVQDALAMFVQRGGIKRGFCGGRRSRPPQNPSFHPLPSPAAEGERERGTNDSEIFMNLGAGGGVRAMRNFYARKKCQHISLEN